MRWTVAQVVLVASLAALATTTLSQTPLPAQNVACAQSRIPFPGFVVTVADLVFAGEPHFKIADLQQIVSDLKQRTYAGPTDGTVAGLDEITRRAWQDEGFFQVQVQSEARVLTSNPVSERVAVTVLVNEGKQYRLSKITFKNNRALTNSTALRRLFPIKDGEIFKRSAIAEGLENLRRAYLQFGYVNATSVPDALINDAAGTIKLSVNIDEGKQFFVSDIHVLGASSETAASLLRDAPLQRGQVYNQRLAEFFFTQGGGLLPHGVSPASRIHLDLDERMGTLVVTYDLRECRQSVANLGAPQKEQ